MSQKTHVPSITSSISEAPGGSNLNNSKTEQFALKSVQASEWLTTLYYVVESLTSAEPKLIELKYMKKRNDGSKYCGEVIFLSCISSFPLYRIVF